jgi:anhydro-N-acetylmuramic acid kinase
MIDLKSGTCRNLKDPIWALGLMSGTSADGIDAALIQTDGITVTAFGPTHYASYPGDVKQQILKAYGRPPEDGCYELSSRITELHADAITDLLSKTDIKPDLIGFHGQTIYHRPPYETHQIGDGDLLASLTGIDVIDQFRINDVAHGGQGAPLVPLFHQALCRDLPKPLAVLNIGGVANVTWMGNEEDDLLAFDVGPGNALIDDWVRHHRGLSCDQNGTIAAVGKIHNNRINRWLCHPYFAKKPPKSLDRNMFHSCLQDISYLSFEDGVATLTGFTAAVVEKSLRHLPEKPLQWIIAGGGAHNQTLMKMIGVRIGSPVQSASTLQWDNDALEAQAFGFLAVRSIRGLPLTMPGTTGVSQPLTGGRQSFSITR